MRWQHHIDAHPCASSDGSVEVFHLKPQQHSVAVRAMIWLTDTAVIVLDFEAVQLHHQLSSVDQALIVRAAVIAAHFQQFLIPPAAQLNVGRADQRLGAHLPEATPS